MSEELGYTPEEVIQQTGENKGNISDIKLARIGAEAEDQKRDQAEKESHFPGSKFLDKVLFKGTLEKNSKAYQEVSGESAGSQAMQDEMEKRALSDPAVGKEARKSLLGHDGWGPQVVDQKLAAEMAQAEKTWRSPSSGRETAESKKESDAIFEQELGRKKQEIAADLASETLTEGRITRAQGKRDLEESERMGYSVSEIEAERKRQEQREKDFQEQLTRDHEEDERRIEALRRQGY